MFMEQDIRELTKIVYEIDKKMGIMIQRNDDFCLQNEKDHIDLKNMAATNKTNISHLQGWKMKVQGALYVISIVLIPLVVEFLKEKFFR